MPDTTQLEVLSLVAGTYTLIHIWLIGSKRVFGFSVGIASNTMWILYAILARAGSGLILVNTVAIVLNIRAIILCIRASHEPKIKPF